MQQCQQRTWEEKIMELVSLPQVSKLMMDGRLLMAFLALWED
jgi:hypothetical protein